MRLPRHVVSTWVLLSVLWQAGLACGSQEVRAAQLLNLLQVERWTTPTGVPVMFLKRDGAPLVRIGVVFDAGANRDGAAWGLANLTAQVVGQGTASMAPEVLMRRRDDQGADWLATVSHDATVVYLSTLRGHLDASLQLFTQAFQAPRFTDKVVGSLRSRLVHNLHAKSSQPMEQAIDAARAAVFPGQGPIEGTLQRVQKLTPHLCKAFYARWWTRRHARLVVVGNMSLAKAHAVTATLSAALRSGGATNPAPPKLPPMHGGTVHLPLHTPQAAVVMVQRALPRHHPLLAQQWLVSKALGRSQDSVLYDALRTAHGWTYAPSALLVPRVHGPQALMVLWASHPGVVDKALHHARLAMERFRREGPSARSLRSIQREQLMQLYTTWSSQQGAMALLVTWAENGQTPESFVARLMRCQNASVEEVRQALPVLLQPLDRWYTVVVGGAVAHGPTTDHQRSHRQ